MLFMFFYRSTHTEISSDKLEDILIKLKTHGFLYVVNDTEPIAILLTIESFKKLHAYAQDKIMDKLRTYDGY
jgi:hypothetical protein